MPSVSQVSTENLKQPTRKTLGLSYEPCISGLLCLGFVWEILMKYCLLKKSKDGWTALKDKRRDLGMHWITVV